MIAGALFVTILAVCHASVAIPETFSSIHNRFVRQVDTNDSDAAAILNLDTETTDPRRLKENWNKQQVWILMNDLFGSKNVNALDKIITPENYIQHNPIVPDGLEAIKTAATSWFVGMPKDKADIRKIAADGEYVYVNWKWVWMGKPVAIVDMFRFENDKVVEHWDVIQEIPEKAVNDHPMF